MFHKLQEEGALPPRDKMGRFADLSLLSETRHLNFKMKFQLVSLASFPWVNDVSNRWCWAISLWTNKLLEDCGKNLADVLVSFHSLSILEGIKQLVFSIWLKLGFYTYLCSVILTLWKGNELLLAWFWFLLLKPGLQDQTESKQLFF